MVFSTTTLGSHMTNLANLRHAFSVNLFLKRVVRILTMGVPMHASRFGLLLAGGRSFRRDPYLCEGVACIFQFLPWISIGVVNCSSGKTCVIFFRFSMLWLLHRPRGGFRWAGRGAAGSPAAWVEAKVRKSLEIHCNYPRGDPILLYLVRFGPFWAG